MVTEAPSGMLKTQEMVVVKRVGSCIHAANPCKFRTTRGFSIKIHRLISLWFQPEVFFTLDWPPGVPYPDDQNCGRLGETDMPKTLPLSEVKTRLPELIAGVDEREEEVVVTKNGRPAAILINVREYERLKETLDVLGDPALMKQIRQSEAFYASGKKGLSYEDVFGEPLKPTRKRRRA